MTQYTKRERGMSLVEVMIAITIGAVLTTGTVQMFVANSETQSLMMGQSRMQESARFAFDFIGRSIQRAGYRGCYSSTADMHDTFDNDDFLPYEFNLKNGIQGFEGVGVDLWSPNFIPPLAILTGNNVPLTDAAGDDTSVYYQTLIASAQSDLEAAGKGAGTGIPFESLIDNTDIITLRYMRQDDVESRLVQRLIGDDPISVYNQPDDTSPVEDHHMAVIHDCAQATIFKITDVSDGAAGQTDIEHDAVTTPTDDVFPIRNDIETLDLRGAFETDAAVAGIESDTYFIAPGTGQNDQGNTPLSLWRKSGLFGPVELVEGVEDLQIRYGESLDDTDTPNRYVLAFQVGDWKDVKTVRVTIVVNSVDDVGATSTPTHTCDVQTCYEGEPSDGIDGLARRSYTQTFKLRNSS